MKTMRDAAAVPSGLRRHTPQPSSPRRRGPSTNQRNGVSGGAWKMRRIEEQNPHWLDLYPQIACREYWIPAFAGMTVVNVDSLFDPLRQGACP
jgi:hypothetical protein